MASLCELAVETVRKNSGNSLRSESDGDVEPNEICVKREEKAGLNSQSRQGKGMQIIN